MPLPADPVLPDPPAGFHQRTFAPVFAAVERPHFPVAVVSAVVEVDLWTGPRPPGQVVSKADPRLAPAAPPQGLQQPAVVLWAGHRCQVDERLPAVGPSFQPGLSRVHVVVLPHNVCGLEGRTWRDEGGIETRLTGDVREPVGWNSDLREGGPAAASSPSWIKKQADYFPPNG